MTKAISAWKAFNKNVVSEVNELKNNMDKNGGHEICVRSARFIIHHERR